MNSKIAIILFIIFWFFLLSIMEFRERIRALEVKVEHLEDKK